MTCNVFEISRSVSVSVNVCVRTAYCFTSDNTLVTSHNHTVCATSQCCATRPARICVLRLACHERVTRRRDQIVVHSFMRPDVAPEHAFEIGV